MTEYRIDAEQLRQHAKRVSALGDSVSQARSAGSTTVSGSAFGIMCAGLAIPVGVVAGGASLAVGRLADELEHLAEGLRAMAANYEGAEAVASTRYDSARRDVQTSFGGR